MAAAINYDRLMFAMTVAGDRRKPSLKFCGAMEKVLEKDLDDNAFLARAYAHYPDALAQIAARREWLSAQKGSTSPCFKRGTNHVQVFMRTAEGAMVPVYFTAPTWARLFTYGGPPPQRQEGLPYSSERPEWSYFTPVPAGAELWYVVPGKSDMVRL